MNQVLLKRTGLFIALLILQVLWLSMTLRHRTGSVRSPDGRIQVQVRAGDRLSYSVSLNGKTAAAGQHALDEGRSANPRIAAEDHSPQSSAASIRQIEPAVRQKFASIRENYNELRLEMEGNYAVVFRAYNEGVAYRFETSLPQPEVKIYSEEVSLNFAGDYNVYYPQEDSFFSHNEREFLYLPLKDIAPGSIASLPAVVDTKDGIKLAIAESDVEDYPGLWLRGNSNNSLSAVFPPYPLKEELTRDRDFKVTQAADYIAVTNGTRTFPWR